MENNVANLFVYGSLRRGFKHVAYEYISRYFRFIDEAKTRGFLYDLGEYPAAIAASEEAFITGELYEIINDEDFSQAFEQLDAYEGVHGEEGGLALYKRGLTEIIYNNTTVKAWIYWYNRDLQDSIWIPSGDIMDIY